MPISDLSGSRAVLLDTHIWVWASGNSGGPSRFAASLAPAIEAAAIQRRLFVSVASVWEIALKAQRGTLLLSGDLRAWIREQRSKGGVQVLPITSSIAIESTTLPLWLRRKDGKEHKDPNDRLLVATARRQGAVLVTCDELILEYAQQGHLLACDGRL
jgi:PIN domain nuclease of toxin-antitoxin system